MAQMAKFVQGRPTSAVEALAGNGPLAMAAGRFTDWVAPRSNTLLALGAGLMSGNDVGQGFANGFRNVMQYGKPADDAYAASQREQGDRMKMIARYSEIIANMGKRYGTQGDTTFQDLADAVSGGAMDPAEAYNAAMAAVAQSRQARNSAANAFLLKDPQLRQAVQSGRLDFKTAYDMERGGVGQENWYGSTIPLQDTTGNVVGYGQISNQGHTKRLDFGDGLTPAAPVNYLDTGSGYIPVYRNGGAPVGGLPAQGGAPQGGLPPAPPSMSGVPVPGMQTPMSSSPVPQPPMGGAGVIPKDNAGAAFQTGIGGANAKRFDQYQTDAQNAYGAINVLDVMGQQMNDPAFYSGTGGELVAGLKRAAASIGINPDGVSSVETFNAMANKATLDAIGGSLGTAISDGDRNFIRTTMANLDNSPNGNRKIIAVQRALAQRKIDMAQLAAEYVQQRGSLDANWPAYLNQWAQQNPLFPDNSAGGGGGAQLPDPFGIRGQ